MEVTSLCSYILYVCAAQYICGWCSSSLLIFFAGLVIAGVGGDLLAMGVLGRMKRLWVPLQTN